ncbi:RagB/SusD family nutrient uptake outer membrane protein [Chitinophaga japonensis]|uniref:Putative outer membrane starch-binding protein n=1 Tax=Chitinophaga japonensis TaxID=104662 RepID=A0A562SZG3_CHIJA|nr:RagB/SusD family nutrient uptake outer membrane protein [Chitinophaga japonensis]TWI86677.1 putative outer membrane starch-binding protein [Chitinophaga japonensis]
MKSEHITYHHTLMCYRSILLIVLLTFGLASCKKLITVDAPSTSISSENVYTNDGTATAVLTDIYANLSAQNSSLYLGTGLPGLSLLASLSADELTLYNLNNNALLSYYINDLTSFTIPNLWEAAYPVIFVTNAAIEGLSNTDALTPAVRRQLMGEARFMRAFCFFYLVNLYGDIPLPLSTNYQINAGLPRAEKTKAYDQIILDLLEARQLLRDEYVAADALSPTNERVRPTSWAAAALLARAYLYRGDYLNAEKQASDVINHGSLYSLPNLDAAFLKNSTEAIWQLQPVGIQKDRNTGEGKLFVLPDTGPDNRNYPVYLSDHLVDSFEAGDQRRVQWIDSVMANGNTYHYASKYKIGWEDVPTAEYVVVLRLGEQYLIRAEARAHSGNLTGAVADLNSIRHRAGLPNTPAITAPDLLKAILQERKAELFTEWGHRWLDLKRSQMVNAVMDIVAPQKGGAWRNTAQLYPIPQTELQKDLNLTQNAGY